MVALALVAGPIHAVDQQDIQPAVAVVIEKRATGAERFRKIFRAERSAVVPEVDAGRSGDVGEAKSRIGGSGRERQEIPSRKVRRFTRCSTRPWRMA